MKEDARKIVKKTIQQYDLIQRGDHIVVGVSGGPDSVCLIHLLHSLSEEYGLTLTAVHINHMLRLGAADEDQCYTQQLCEKMEITCHSFAFDVRALSREWKMTEEEAGRKVRYDSFYQILQQVGANKIAVAQNQNDQAETILMRLMRGTGTDGLAGMEYIREACMIRPLLDVSRALIEAYCAQNGLEPRLDQSNEKPVYTRNKIRLALIPFIQENFDENIVRHLSQLAKTVQEDKDFLYQAVNEAYGQRLLQQGQVRLPKTAFKGWHPSIQKRMLLRGFAEIGLEQDIETVHLENALKLIDENRTSAGMDFPCMYRLTVDYQEIVLQKTETCRIAEKEKKEEIPLIMNQKVYAADFHMAVSCSILSAKPDMSTYEQAQVFDLDKINGELTLRGRRAGDTIAPYGMKGHKKLKVFLIDEKIPAANRSRLPLICLGSEVVWVIGLRASETFRTDENTRRYLLIQVQKTSL